MMYHLSKLILKKYNKLQVYRIIFKLYVNHNNHHKQCYVLFIYSICFLFVCFLKFCFASDFSKSKTRKHSQKVGSSKFKLLPHPLRKKKNLIGFHIIALLDCLSNLKVYRNFLHVIMLTYRNSINQSDLINQS